MTTRMAPNGSRYPQAAIEHSLKVERAVPGRPVVDGTVGKYQPVAVKLGDTLVTVPGCHTEGLLGFKQRFDTAAIGQATQQHLAKLVALDRSYINRGTIQ
jgi:hypothetical protein